MTLREVAGPDAPPDLRGIIEQALRDDPEQRYADAHELALDLGRFLDGHRVAAYDYSTFELLRRVVKAWRAPLAVAGAAALLLGAVGISAWVGTTRARDRAIVAEGETRSALELSDRDLASSLEGQAAVALGSGRVPEAEVLAAHSLVARESPVARGVLVAAGSAPHPRLLQVAPMPSCAGVRLGATLLFCLQPDGMDVRGDDGALLWRAAGSVEDVVEEGRYVVLTRRDMALEVRARATGEVLHSFRELPGNTGLEVAFDGSAVGLANGDGAVVVDLASMTITRTTPCSMAAPATAMALGSGRAWVMCRGREIISIASDQLSSLGAQTAGPYEPAVLAASGGVLLAGTARGWVIALDGLSGALLARHQVADLHIDGLLPVDGAARVAVTQGRAGIRIWDALRGIEEVRLPGPTRAQALAGPGVLRIAGHDLRSWQLPVAVRPRRFQAPTGLAALAVSPDGGLVAVARGDGAVTAWSTSDGGVRLDRAWQDRVAKWVAFSGDGRRLLGAALGDATTRVWDTEDWTESVRGEGHLCRRMAELADGRTWCAGYGDRISVQEGDALSYMPLPTPIFDAATTSDAEVSYWLAEDGRVLCLRSGRPSPEALFTEPGARAIGASDSGRLALLFERELAITDEGGLVIARIGLGIRGASDLALSPDARWAAVGTLDGRVELFDVARATLVASLQGHTERVGALAFTADSAGLYSGDWSGTVLRWDLTRVETAPEAMLAEVETTWRLGLEAAMAAGI